MGEGRKSANVVLSKRLVDYFVVYSCKPQRRHKDENVQDGAPPAGERKQTGDTNNGGVGKDQDMVTPERTKSINLASSKKSPIVERRTSSRAVHFTVASDGGIIGKSGSAESPRDGSRQLEKLDEVTPLMTTPLMTTPLMANRKGVDAGPDLHLSIKPSSSDEVSLAPNFRGSRIPVTGDSESGVFSSTDDEDYDDDNDGDDDDDNDDDAEGLHQTPPRPGLGGEHDNDEFMTPSRTRRGRAVDLDTSMMTPSRARAMDSDSDEEEPNNAEFSDVCESDDRGPPVESENIHLPAVDSAEDHTNPLSAEFSLVPVKTAQYPPHDHSDCPLNPMVSHFCFPQVLSLTTDYQMPKIHFFVLTNDRGKKMYGTCLTVWEKYQHDDSNDFDDEVASVLSGIRENINGDGQDIEISLLSDNAAVYIPKVLCILSSWPYLHAFREYLGQLYRLATMTNLMTAPIERYIMNLCDEAPAPPPGVFGLRLKVRVSL